ncbi:hypothetical protein, partial [Rhizobium sophoriradicis]
YSKHEPVQLSLDDALVARLLKGRAGRPFDVLPAVEVQSQEACRRVEEHCEKITTGRKVHKKYYQDESN